MKKRNLVIIVMGLVALLGGVFWFAQNNTNTAKQEQSTQQTQSKENVDDKPQPYPLVEISDDQLLSTENWKTYEHPRYTVKYPPNWYLIERTAEMDEKEHPDDYRIYISANPRADEYYINETGDVVYVDDWAFVDFQIFTKNTDESVQLWASNRPSGPGVLRPELQVQIANKTFPGSTNFNKEPLTSPLSGFFELNAKKALEVRLPSRVKHKDAVKTYLTILSTIEIN